jgi:hypothetical protein
MNSTRKWFWVRVAIIVVAALQGVALTSPRVIARSNIDWLACGVLLLACPFALLAVISLQALNPMSAPIWRRPSWGINPFLVTEPLQFFHLASFCFMAAGAGGMGALPVRGGSAAPLAASLLAVGVGLWLADC